MRAFGSRHLLAVMVLCAASSPWWLAVPSSEQVGSQSDGGTSNAPSAASDRSTALESTISVEAEPAREAGPPASQTPRTRARFSPMRVARATGGIRCPDGTFLPPLNGVLPTDPIPPIERERYMPAIGAIVGRYTDESGADWWVTEDGSAFTTRWQEITLADGSRARVVRLDQSDACGDRFASRAR